MKTNFIKLRNSRWIAKMMAIGVLFLNSSVNASEKVCIEVEVRLHQDATEESFVRIGENVIYGEGKKKIEVPKNEKFEPIIVKVLGPDQYDNVLIMYDQSGRALDESQWWYDYRLVRRAEGSVSITLKGGCYKLATQEKPEGIESVHLTDEDPPTPVQLKVDSEFGEINSSSVNTHCSTGSCPLTKCDDEDSKPYEEVSPTAPDLSPSKPIFIDLGKDSNELPIGTLQLLQDLSDGSINLDSIKVLNGLSDLTPQIISDTNGIRQVRVHQGLIDIALDSNGALQISIYPAASVGSQDSNGIYSVAGSPKSNLTMAPSTLGTKSGYIVSVTQYGSTTITEDYVESSSNGHIVTSVAEDGKITDVTNLVEVDPADSTYWERQEIRRVYSMVGSSEVIHSEEHRFYSSEGYGEKLRTLTVDPNGANDITTYAYYESDPDSAYFRKLKHIIYPDGKWEKRFYDSNGRLVRKSEPWLDAPTSPNLVGDSDHHLGAQETYEYYQGFLSATRKFVLGTQVSAMHYSKDEAYEDEGISSPSEEFIALHTMQSHGDLFNPSSSSSFLLNTTVYHKEFHNDLPFEGELYLKLSPTANAQRFIVEKGTFNESTQTFTLANGGAYTRYIQTEGTATMADGIANHTTRKITINGPNGVMREEAQVYNGTTYETTEVVTHQYESTGQKRLLSTTRNGSVVYSVNYISPTERIVTDELGTQTSEIYDNVGRLVESTKLGISAGVDHEAQLDITTSYNESGNTSTTEVVAGTFLSTTSSTVDAQGRGISVTNEAGLTTTTTYSNHGRTITTTSPGGLTTIQDHYLDGKLKSITGTAVVPEFHAYAVDVNGNQVHTVYYGTNDDTSPRWRKTVTNGLGQVLSEESPSPNGNPMVVEQTYNNKGQLIKTTRTGLADTLYEYDELGRLVRQGQDLNTNGSLNLASNDAVREVDQYYEKDANDDWWEVSLSRTYLTDGDDNDVAESITKRKLGTGAGSVVVHITPDSNTTTSTTVVDQPNKTVTTTTTSSLSSVSAVQVQVNGLLISQSSLTVSAPTLMHYDGLGRQTQVIDARTSMPASTTTYDSNGQVATVTDGEGNTTTYTYYGNTHANAGMLASQTNEEGETIRYAYDNLGRLTHQWGDGTNPIAYVYDAFGQMIQLKTYRGSGDWTSATLPASFATGTPDITTWTYHAASGVLLAKTDASSEAVTYTYHEDRSLASRTWARGVETEYTYDNLGRLIEVNYSDSTPDVTHTYRRDGQRLTTTDAAGTRTFTYAEGTGQLSSESIGSGLLAGLQGTYAYDTKGRPNGHSTQFSSTGLTSVSYGYDSVGRWNTVSANGLSAEYHYATNSNLVSGMSLKQGTTLLVTNTKSYDDANRLTSTSWADEDDTELSSHSYLYDGANRRVRSTLVDGSYWEYAYNAKGEVTGAVKKNASGTPFPGLQYGYSFDEIGNRVSASVDAALSGTRSTSYTSNALNQYTSIGTPNAFDVIGSAASSAIVKVNTETADRLGPYFRKEVTVNNSASAVWQGLNLEFTLSGAGVGGGDIVTQRSGHHYVAPATSSPTYDEDGNLTSDSRWTYTWDGENRLVAMESNTTALSAGVPKRRLEFLYDGQSRRISKKVMDWNATTSAWVTKDERRFVYDGWNLVAEVDGSGNLIKSHTWGLDLSQSQQGAGGVGGLLWTHDTASSQTHFMAYDGNGNVTALVKADTTNTVSARYDYNAFGETVLQEGDGTASSNPYRFSTKYQDKETGLYYYGYRYYDATKGRWLNRDPIGESGGVNLYGMVGNGSLNRVDPLGLRQAEYTPENTFSITAYATRIYGDGGIEGSVMPSKFEFRLDFNAEQQMITYGNVRLALSASWPVGNTKIKLHEMRHAEDWWRIWRLIHTEAERFKRPCATDSEYKCFEKAWDLELAAYQSALSVLARARHSNSNDPVMVYPERNTPSPDKSRPGQAQLYKEARAAFRTKKQTALIAYLGCKNQFEDEKLTFTAEVVKLIQKRVAIVDAQIDSILSENAGQTVASFPGKEQFQ